MIPPAKKGIKNDKGDYIVTSFNIADERTGIKRKNAADQGEDSSDSDEVYGDEDDNKEEAKVEETPAKGKYNIF